MENIILEKGKFYRIIFTDGQPIEFKSLGNDANNDSLLCEKQGGETFYLDTMEPFEKIIPIENWGK